MLLFAHTGITTGIAWLSSKAVVRVRQSSAAKQKVGRDISADVASCSPGNYSGTNTQAIRIDYRLILLGSLLPDLIDKPLGIWLLRDTFNNGRIFTHTLLFSVLLLAVAIYFYTSRRNLSLLYLSFGSIIHLGLDGMWLNSRTFLWPLYGWNFEKVDLSNLLERWIVLLRTEPAVYIPEIIGLVTLGFFFINLIRQGKLYQFFMTGKAN